MDTVKKMKTIEQFDETDRATSKQDKETATARYRAVASARKSKR